MSVGVIQSVIEDYFYRVLVTQYKPVAYKNLYEAYRLYDKSNSMIDMYSRLIDFCNTNLDDLFLSVELLRAELENCNPSVSDCKLIESQLRATEIQIEQFEQKRKAYQTMRSTESLRAQGCALNANRLAKVADKVKTVDAWSRECSELNPGDVCLILSTDFKGSNPVLHPDKISEDYIAIVNNAAQEYWQANRAMYQASNALEVTSQLIAEGVPGLDGELSSRQAALNATKVEADTQSAKYQTERARANTIATNEAAKAGYRSAGFAGLVDPLAQTPEQWFANTARQFAAQKWNPFFIAGEVVGTDTSTATIKPTVIKERVGNTEIDVTPLQLTSNFTVSRTDYEYEIGDRALIKVDNPTTQSIRPFGWVSGTRECVGDWQRYAATHYSASYVLPPAVPKDLALKKFIFGRRPEFFTKRSLNGSGSDYLIGGGSLDGKHYLLRTSDQLAIYRRHQVGQDKLVSLDDDPELGILAFATKDSFLQKEDHEIPPRLVSGFPDNKNYHDLSGDYFFIGRDGQHASGHVIATSVELFRPHQGYAIDHTIMYGFHFYQPKTMSSFFIPADRRFYFENGSTLLAGYYSRTRVMGEWVVVWEWGQDHNDLRWGVISSYKNGVLYGKLSGIGNEYQPFQDGLWSVIEYPLEYTSGLYYPKIAQISENLAVSWAGAFNIWDLRSLRIVKTIAATSENLPYYDSIHTLYGAKIRHRSSIWGLGNGFFALARRANSDNSDYLSKFYTVYWYNKEDGTVHRFKGEMNNNRDKYPELVNGAIEF